MIYKDFAIFTCAVIFREVGNDVQTYFWSNGLPEEFSGSGCPQLRGSENAENVWGPGISFTKRCKMNPAEVGAAGFSCVCVIFRAQHSWERPSLLTVDRLSVTTTCGNFTSCPHPCSTTGRGAMWDFSCSRGSPHLSLQEPVSLYREFFTQGVLTGVSPLTKTLYSIFCSRAREEQSKHDYTPRKNPQWLIGQINLWNTWTAVSTCCLWGQYAEAAVLTHKVKLSALFCNVSTQGLVCVSVTLTHAWSLAKALCNLHTFPFFPHLVSSFSNVNP